MGVITIVTQSSASVPLPAVNQLRLFVDSADSILKTKDSFGVVRPSGVGTADELSTTGAPVDVSASSPPTSGQILIATSPTTAVWQTVPAATRLATSGAPVVISAAAPPSTGQVLTATSATTAAWQTPSGGGGTLTPTAVVVGPDVHIAAVGELVLCDISGGLVEIELPSGHSAGDQIGVKVISAASGNTAEIIPDGVESVDGDPDLVLATDYEWAILMSDGTNWMQIG